MAHLRGPEARPFMAANDRIAFIIETQLGDKQQSIRHTRVHARCYYPANTGINNRQLNPRHGCISITVIKKISRARGWTNKRLSRGFYSASSWKMPAESFHRFEFPAGGTKKLDALWGMFGVLGFFCSSICPRTFVCEAALLCAAESASKHHFPELRRVSDGFQVYGVAIIGSRPGRAHRRPLVGGVDSRNRAWPPTTLIHCDCWACASQVQWSAPARHHQLTVVSKLTSWTLTPDL